MPTPGARTRLEPVLGRPGQSSQTLTGDRHQRCEVTYFDLWTRKRWVLARTDSYAGALDFVQQIEACATMAHPRIREREEWDYAPAQRHAG